MQWIPNKSWKLIFKEYKKYKLISMEPAATRQKANR